ncbi:hypothetical protein CBQ28_01155 [Pseudoalteromonas sp. GCY]|uniref:TniQ family protein n=1 Tax=Pseudoalteromonas sp. GCY TaxID=2003316 RepID=UPI000BFEF35A|nr:TniQ family protein [Pseudoalteromonas sp. GCY]PHI39158.1 hypothetical protein CBQ28_01155 [Pseudoalteromonas sp. GCY]QQQ65120.1 TniQ family protein [Pseudoalteromonas sp. GCY]
MKFAVIPTVFSNESVIGHTLRLLKRNGFKHITHVLKQPEITRLIKWQKSKVDTLDNLTFKKAVTPQTPFPFWEKSLLTTVQVCPQCMEKNGYFHEEWQKPFIKHCEKHQCMLVSECLSCGEKLKFDIQLLANQCTNPKCGKSLSSKPLIVGLNDEERVFDCYLAAYVLNDLCESSAKYPSESINHNDLYIGLEFLGCEQKARAWLNKLVRNSNKYIPLNIVLANVLTLTKYLKCDWPALVVFKNMYEFEYPSTTNDLFKPIWLTIDKATSLLAIDLTGLELLLASKLVLSKTRNGLNNRSVINVSPIFEMLKQSSQIENMEPLAVFKQTMLYNDICIADILIGVLDGKLNVGYVTDNDLLSSLFVKPKQFKSFCSQIFGNKRDEVISIQKASQLTGLSHNSLMKLRKQGKLRIPAWTYNTGQVVYEDVLRIRVEHAFQLNLEF